MIQVNLKLFIVLLIIIILMETDRCGAVHRVHVSDQLPFQWRRYRQTWSCSQKAIARPAPPVPTCSSDSTATPAWAPCPLGLGRTPCLPSLMVSASLCLVHRSTRLSVHPPVSPARVWLVHHCIFFIGPHVCLSIFMFLCPGYGQYIIASFPSVHTSVCPPSCFSVQGMVIASLCFVCWSTCLSVHPDVSLSRVTVLILPLSSDLFLLHDFSEESEVEEQRHRLLVALLRLTTMSWHCTVSVYCALFHCGQTRGREQMHRLCAVLSCPVMLDFNPQ